VGVPANKIRAVAPGGSLEVLSAAEHCAVDFAREVARSRTTDETLFQRLESNFSPPQIVDLVITTAWYHLCAVILGSLQVELEGGDR
jgi:alkylhydroperoxidase family enzyme